MHGIKEHDIKKPIIGITIDYQEGSEDGYSRFPWYALRSASSLAVSDAGGIPVFLPYSTDDVAKYTELCDGIIISGGHFDIPPSFYKGESTHKSTILNECRTKFEFALLTNYFSSKKPILGLCGGMQLINVIKGGTLIQHIEDEIDSNIKHEQNHPKDIPSHFVNCNSNSQFFSIVNTKRYMVNSTHHQAVKTLGDNLNISASSDDGIIEAIECENHPFCIGVQWHAEFMKTPQDTNLFKYFIKACGSD